MIQVIVKRDNERAITEVIIEGHAGYADKGEDLVCAAVSAITFGIANSIEALLNVETVAAISDSGFLHFKIPYIKELEVRNRVLLLMEAMLVSLNTVVDSYSDGVERYSDYIQIIDNP